jgi:hypothetical protein
MFDVKDRNWIVPVLFKMDSRFGRWLLGSHGKAHSSSAQDGPRLEPSD